MSTSALALGVALVITLTKLRSAFKGGGWAAVKSELTADTRKGALIALSIWAVLFLLFFGAAIFQDHAGLAKRLGQVHTQSHADTRIASQTISDLRTQCAVKEGISQTLRKQTEDQQLTINGCFSQAIKLLTPEDLRVHAVTLGPMATAEDLKRDPVHPISMLVLTNKPIVTTKFKVECDQSVEILGASIVGSQATQFSQWNGRVSDRVYMVGISAPDWTPMAPLLITLRNQKEPAHISCGISQELK